MARKRSPENDWICQRCGCPCDPAGTRHLGGGQGMRACRWAPDPMLRSAFEADVAKVIKGLRDRR